MSEPYAVTTAGVERNSGEYTIEPLAPATWDALAGLCERHKGKRCAFDYARSKGTRNCVMRTTVPPA